SNGASLGLSRLRRASGPCWRSPTEHSGNGILRAETARAFRAATARKASNSRAEADAAPANPRKCRGPSQTRKTTEFAETGWWSGGDSNRDALGDVVRQTWRCT